MRILFLCGLMLFTFAGQTQPQISSNPLQRAADSLYFNNDYRRALEKYTALAKSSDNAPVSVYARIAFCNHYTGKYNEAMLLYDDLLKKQVSAALKPQLYSRMAMTYARKQDKKKALVFLDSAVVNGYSNTWELQNSSDFDLLREHSEFRQLYERTYTNAFPCRTRKEARLFDFWIGEWEVYNNQYPNHRVGTSKIENVSGECTILENFEGFQSGYSGKSQNWYDPATKKWTQLWIGSGGGFQYFTDGEYKDGAMRFKCKLPGPNGALLPGNFIFYNLGPDKVRQYQEVSADSGRTYRVVYDFIYYRKNDDEQKIKKLKARYVNAWKTNDEHELLELFDDNATLGSLHPATGKPVKGKKQLSDFWFPDDSSRTTILEYTNNMIGLHISGDMAQSSHQSYVKWLYEKNGVTQVKEQKSYGSALYKKQTDGEWKYFHLMSMPYKGAELAKTDRKRDEECIRLLNKNYVNYWLDNNENGVLSLFTPTASLAPSGLPALKGMKEIKEFWFPKDGSVTKILKFSNDIMNIHFDGNVAETSQSDHLLWSYKNGTQELTREQWGFATTLYQKQDNGKWKIIHQMWKDYKVNDLNK